MNGHAPEHDGPDIEGQPADRQRLLVKPLSSSGKPAYAPDRALIGLAFYALSSVFLATMLVAAKLLGKRSYPTWQTLLARSTIIMLFALAACAKQRKNPFGNRRRLLALRGACGFGAIGCYFFAINNLQLADAMVLTFLAPLWVAILAPVFLKEQFSWPTIVAIPVCLLGVALITQPPFLGLAPAGQGRSKLGIACACGQALFSACAKMAVRELRKTDTANVSVFYLSFSSTIGATTGFMISHFAAGQPGPRVPGDALDWVLFALVGLCGYGTQLCMTVALKYAKAAPALAMSYLSVVWGILGSLLVFHEKPNALSIAGAAVICSCTFLLTMAVKRQPAKAEEEVAEQPEQAGMLQEPLLAGEAAHTDAGQQQQQQGDVQAAQT